MTPNFSNVSSTTDFVFRLFSIAVAFGLPVVVLILAALLVSFGLFGTAKIGVPLFVVYIVTSFFVFPSWNYVNICVLFGSVLGLVVQIGRLLGWKPPPDWRHGPPNK